jgi:hypothetical protein
VEEWDKLHFRSKAVTSAKRAVPGSPLREIVKPETSIVKRLSKFDPAPGPPEVSIKSDPIPKVEDLQQFDADAINGLTKPLLDELSTHFRLDFRI